MTRPHTLVNRWKIVSSSCHDRFSKSSVKGSRICRQVLWSEEGDRVVMKIWVILSGPNDLSLNGQSSFWTRWKEETLYSNVPTFLIFCFLDWLNFIDPEIFFSKFGHFLNTSSGPLSLNWARGLEKRPPSWARARDPWKGYGSGY